MCIRNYNFTFGTMKATDRQEGGDHYKNYPIEPVEFIYRNRIPFIEANVIKYILRHESKDGLKDLLKAKHYIELLIQYKYENQRFSETPVS